MHTTLGGFQKTDVELTFDALGMSLDCRGKDSDTIVQSYHGVQFQYCCTPDQTLTRLYRLHCAIGADGSSVKTPALSDFSATSREMSSTASAFTARGHAPRRVRELRGRLQFRSSHQRQRLPQLSSADYEARSLFLRPCPIFGRTLILRSHGNPYG